MLPKKPKREDFHADDQGELTYICHLRDYYKAIAERAIEALKSARNKLSWKPEAYYDIDDALREIQASEEE